MLEHVLVPLDGSSLAESALEQAIKLVKPAGKITLLTVLQNPEYPIYDFYPMTTALMHNYDKALNEAVPRAKEYLDRIADNIEEKHNLRACAKVEAGDPADVIIETADKLHVDAIVMSTHGRSGISRWLFGSVTARVVGSGCCPVFVIPTRQMQKRKTAELQAVQTE